MAQLLAAVLDVSFGTIWRVREDLWKAHQAGYHLASSRTWHPGVSIRRQDAGGVALWDAVPMLHGTSGDAGPVVVRGISDGSDSGKATSFGRLVAPARFGVGEFVSRAPDAKAGDVEGPWFRRRKISANLPKPKLEPKEVAELGAWARERGLS